MAPRPPRKVPEFTEVDYKTKAGVAWSHNYLNQKPWHPMSYPNQRRKWIAEQEHAVRETQKGVAAKEVIAWGPGSSFDSKLLILHHHLF